MTEAQAETGLRLEFHGRAADYFGIWLVNTGLTILTLGIFSAWAKVRRKRFFLGHTRLAGDAFDYHARPVQILIGRAIVIAALVLISGAETALPTVAPFTGLLVLAAAPWIVGRAIRFNARVTSWRNVRFDFATGYGAAFVRVLLLPLLGIVTLGLAVPYASKIYRTWFLAGHRFGQSAFTAEIALGPLYLAAAVAVGIFLLFGAGAALLIVALGGGVGAWQLAILGFIVGGFAANSYYRAVARNVTLNGAEITGGHRLASDLSPLGFAWVVVSNAALVIATLGLATPWAAVRSWRYQTAAIRVVAASDLAEFVDGQIQAGSAIGDAAADFEGFDIGI